MKGRPNLIAPSGQLFTRTIPICQILSPNTMKLTSLKPSTFSFQNLASLCLATITIGALAACSSPAPTTAKAKPANSSSTYCAPKKVDILVFSDCKDPDSMKGLEYVRAARSSVTKWTREYAEFDYASSNDKMKETLNVNCVPLVILIRDGYEVSRFTPESKSMVISNVKSASM